MGGTQLWLEVPFGEVLSSAVRSVEDIYCGCFAICSFHCCINERHVHMFDQKNVLPVQGPFAAVPDKCTS